MRELTLDQMGKEISAAAQALSWAQRKELSAALLENLRKSIGALKIRREK
jgi:hypothetical protein